MEISKKLLHGWVWIFTAMAVCIVFGFKNFSEERLVVSHYSYFSQPEFFNEAFKAVYPKDYSLPIQGILVNHHLLAPQLIAEAFNAIATTAPITVLLVSPNHFGVGRASVITSLANWQTPFGVLRPDTKLVKELVNKNMVSVEEHPFEQEHGVSGLVGFIKKTAPNAKVIPIIVKDRLTLTEAQKLAQQYYKVLNTHKAQPLVVVGSFDFSHYLTSRASDFHDEQSLAVLQQFDYKKLQNLDIDSRPGLAMFLELMRLQSATKFTMFQHTNSAKLVRQDILEGTSYITGGFSLGESATGSVDTLLSLGKFGENPNRSWDFMKRLFIGQDKILSLDSPFKLTPLSYLNIKHWDSEITLETLGDIKLALVNCSVAKDNWVVKSHAEGARLVICQDAPFNKIAWYKDSLIIWAKGFQTEGNESMAIGVTVKANQLKIYLFPIGNIMTEPKLLIGSDNDTILSEMARQSEGSQEIKNKIKTGVINLPLFK